jgi:hypothetical protein
MFSASFWAYVGIKQGIYRYRKKTPLKSPYLPFIVLWQPELMQNLPAKAVLKPFKRLLTLRGGIVRQSA